MMGCSILTRSISNLSGWRIRCWDLSLSGSDLLDIGAEILSSRDRSRLPGSRRLVVSQVPDFLL
jgi:hypothetical protein